MNAANREALTLARRRGFIVARRNATGAKLAAEWRRHCMQWRIPYVRIEPRSSWASLTMDMEPTGARLSPLACEHIGQLVLFERALQPKRARGFVGWGNTTFMGNVPLSRAEHLAGKLLGEALADLRRQEGG